MIDECPIHHTCVCSGNEYVRHHGKREECACCGPWELAHPDWATTVELRVTYA